jgi:hypothetical protein
MELKRTDAGLVNGSGEPVDIEDSHLYPMFKSSEVANGSEPVPHRWMIVPQRVIGEDTGPLEEIAPKTWRYLEAHSDRMGKRGSSIYRGRPKYSIFGVGEYSFSPWKVAISGFYKRLSFKVIGPHAGKPVVFDDTVYFLPCGSEEEARLIGELLRSEAAREFFEAFVFWDAKRPITVELLNRLDLGKLAQSNGYEMSRDEQKQMALL